ncbi:MAG: hypothetical protein KDA99_06095, partial [Planctomycetales bacterium]|nr:hypothetical protein [Planctomycetales bacterium]
SRMRAGGAGRSTGARLPLSSRSSTPHRPNSRQALTNTPRKARITLGDTEAPYCDIWNLRPTEPQPQKDRPQDDL